MLFSEILYCNFDEKRNCGNAHADCIKGENISRYVQSNNA